jgi:protein-L-isoaspartate(D-aspartate) O-methyltransferase
MHAYARSYALLAPRPGDTVLDLGCGTGYGATLLARLVGESGRVYGVELDPRLAALAQENVGSLPHVTIVAGDAADPSAWPVVGAARVVVGFALAEVPLAWAAALAPGAVVVAPVVDGDGQRLVRVTFLAEPVVEAFEPVFYVPQRSVAELPPPREARAQVSASVRRHLPLLT